MRKLFMCYLLCSLCHFLSTPPRAVRVVISVRLKERFAFIFMVDRLKCDTGLILGEARGQLNYKQRNSMIVI